MTRSSPSIKSTTDSLPPFGTGVIHRQIWGGFNG
ncbi:hypothetical protein PSP31121_05667 [Pandoraea sputorum]|uniref:Uncharacterized protein n=1 Tax=Pandoraea sputorum TaxID=93222 RepID=A0A5E5BKY5_9BURK|nr:hypothetical protein PSP31121_05667 [Pandoraea sputorum]